MFWCCKALIGTISFYFTLNDMGTDNPVHLTANVARYSQRAHFSYCVYVHIFAYSSAMWLDPHRRIPLCILCAVCVGTVVCGNGFLQNSEIWIETLKSKSQNLKIWTFQSSEKCGNFHKRLSLRIYVFRPCWVFGSPTSFTGVEASICMLPLLCVGFWKHHTYL